MRDGRTRRVQSDDSSQEFLEHNRASLTLLTGNAAGSEFSLASARYRVGRAEGSDIRLDDPSVSAEHASVELGPDGFGIRDLASTNGVHVNGAAVEACALKHGDRIAIGTCELQYVVEPREGGGGRRWQLDVS